MTGVYAVFQNYVADFAFGCGYFAVFIYNQFAVGCIECTVTVYEERHGAVFICSTYGQVVFCVQGIGLDGVYTGNVTFFIDSYLTKFSGIRSDLAVATACIAYEQLAIKQFGMTGVYAVFQNYVADFAFGCGYFAVFIYNQFAVGCIECTVTVYEERHGAVFICSTYGQVVFCVQCIGLDGVCTGNVAFIIDSYLTNFACGCGYFAVCIYREFIIGCMEITGAVYNERKGPIGCLRTYYQIIFGIQCIGINNIGIDIRCLYLAHSHNASKSKCS